MKADALFQKYAAAAGLAVEAPILKAYPVKKGESVVVNAGVNIQTTAEDDGWQAYLDGKGFFLTNEEFAANTEKVDPDRLGIVKQNLPDDANPRAVQKGERIVVQPWSDTDLGVSKTADEAGYVLAVEGKKKFMSDIEFRTAFNTNAAPLDQSQALYRVKPAENSTTTRYVVLPEDVPLDFKAGEYKAPAGSVVYENDNDEDGYTAVPYNYFVKRFAPKSL